MKLKLFRSPQSACTEGRLFIDDKFYCTTLEDPNRDKNKSGGFDGEEKKIAGDTCIPYGTYSIIVNISPKFGRELPRLLNVPSFEGVLIHRGNTAKDTAGCILVGEKVSGCRLYNSSSYEIDLTNKIKKAISEGEKVTIEIV